MNTTCPRCHGSNVVGSTYCAHCASPLSLAYAAPPPDLRPSRGTAVLVLGILSLTICGIFGPIAWAMGRGELNRIMAGEASPQGRGLANAGMICGIVGTLVLALQAVMLVLML